MLVRVTLVTYTVRCHKLAVLKIDMEAEKNPGFLCKETLVSDRK